VDDGPGDVIPGELWTYDGLWNFDDGDHDTVDKSLGDLDRFNGGDAVRL
jgi:hypothetical protein